ncbi:hypothetical protein NDU88_004612 [Pleurodeles waltl]|uniref:Gypsy retrotransposon integrase-like protein 1 n=1 Tax=Pleurodeles waltl TaxID=8319 RepID=A0AAV7NSZ0_PLEWA|nr:hypothetical protein NDU88_004612 [Pleurodeles waltl]
MSRKLNEAEKNYVIAEKELLAICDAFKEWRHHLLGAKYTVTVYTDHRNLQFMSSARLLTPRQLRWMLFFAEFDFVVTFRPGKDNRKADALSRQESTTLPAVQTSRAIIAPDKVLCIIKTEDFFEDIRNSFTVEKWQAWAQADPKRSIKQGLPFYDARLFVPTTKLRKIVFHWLHVIPTAGHPGAPKTLELIQRYFWWPTLTKDVKTMVNNCEVCARTKISHSKPKGLLHPLPTPSRPWEHISLDFITGLPVVQQHSVILVVVDSLTKYGHFIACKKLPTSSELATILLNRVVRYHGLPKVILSDRVSQFAYNFWKTWCKTLQVTSTLSTSHHPQTDGQTERLNQTLKQYLRAYAEKTLNSWTSMLWLAELAYNNSFHTSTGVTPFFGLFGYHPDTLPITIPQESSLTPAVSEIIQHLHQTQKSIQQHLEKAKQKYKKHYDKKHCEGPQYQPGDKVWLSTKHIDFKTKHMFNPKFIGPYTVLQQINPVTYKLQFPKSLRIHPVFHTSLLKKAVQKVRPHPAPVLVQGEEEYEVKKVLDSKLRGRNLWYLIPWKGYGPESNSWVSASDVHAPVLVRRFHPLNPDKPGPRARLGEGSTVNTRTVRALRASRMQKNQHSQDKVIYAL